MYCVVGCAWFVFVVYSWFGRLVGFVVQFWVSLLGGCGHGLFRFGVAIGFFCGIALWFFGLLLVISLFAGLRVLVFALALSR